MTQNHPDLEPHILDQNNLGKFTISHSGFVFIPSSLLSQNVLVYNNLTFIFPKTQTPNLAYPSLFLFTLMVSHQDLKP